MSRTGQPRLRILITEDHASTRMGIKQILREEYPRAVFGEAGNAREALALLDGQNWDLLILDITLPDRHGLEVLKEARTLRPSLPVLVYSAHDEEQFAIHLLRIGARGYLTKERAPEELVRAAREILGGRIYLSPALMERVASEAVSGQGRKPHERLSRREFEVMRQIAQGKSGKEIAVGLAVSDKTVSTYRARILAKLGVRTTAELVRYVIEHGLL